MERYILILVLFFSPFIANAQHKKTSGTEKNQHTIKNLNIGDKVPDIFISKIVNDANKNVNISAFKDVLLILDFWTTGCASCIEAFPKMDSLQKVFSPKIKILGVTYESEDHVNHFFKTNKYAKSTPIASIVEDKILNKWFKHWAIPHEVWIYKGKVIALTGAEYVTAKNIQYILDGHIPEWPVKNDDQEIDYSKSLISTDQFHQSLFYTAITSFKEGVHDKKIVTSLDSTTGIRRNYFVNLGILPAYKILWSYLVKKPLSASNANRVILNVKDKSKYIYSSDYGPRAEWNKKNQLCYESVTINKGDIQEQYKLMISDLNRLLGLDAHWEKRKTKCLVLIRTSAEDKIGTKGGETHLSITTPLKEFKNTTLSNFVYLLNSYESNPPVFDETGYKDKVDLKLKINLWTDVSSIRSELQNYGLDLREEEREIDMFILAENNIR